MAHQGKLAGKSKSSLSRFPSCQVCNQKHLCNPEESPGFWESYHTLAAKQSVNIALTTVCCLGTHIHTCSMHTHTHTHTISLMI